MFGSETGGSQGKHMKKLREEHVRYLETYKLFNKGSAVGATSFDKYYIYRTFVNKYADLKTSNAMGYR
jgi:hypothetical protein